MWWHDQSDGEKSGLCTHVDTDYTERLQILMNDNTKYKISNLFFLDKE